MGIPLNQQVAILPPRDCTKEPDFVEQAAGMTFHLGSCGKWAKPAAIRAVPHTISAIPVAENHHVG
jgi:hypothetical protein